MKPFAIDALLAVLCSAGLQGSFAASPLGGTPRHSRLRVKGAVGPSFLQLNDNIFFGQTAFEHLQPSTPSLQLGEATRNEHGEGSQHAEALGMSLMLMGGIAFQMAIFYVVNFPAPGIVLSIWRVFNTACSIFISVMLYDVISLHWAWASAQTTQHHALLPVFLVCYLASCASVRVPWTSAENIQALAMISGHVTGFAAMYCCADLQKVTLLTGIKISTGVWMLSVLVLAAVVLIVLGVCAEQVGNKRELQLEKEDTKLIEKTQDNVFCLSMSFCIVAIIRFCISGDFQDYESHAKFKGVTQAHANQLLLCGSVFGIAACTGPCLLQHCLNAEAQPSGALARVLGILVRLQGLIFAWVLLFWAEWQLQLWSWECPLIGGSLTVASAATIFSCLVIVVSSYAAKCTTDSLELALGLLVGFSWQRSFAIGFEDISDGVNMQSSRINPLVMSKLFTVLLLVVGVPAWRLFVLPRAMQLENIDGQDEQTLEKALEAVAGKKVKSSVGRNIGWQFIPGKVSTPRRLSLP